MIELIHNLCDAPWLCTLNSDLVLEAPNLPVLLYVVDICLLFSMLNAYQYTLHNLMFIH